MQECPQCGKLFDPVPTSGDFCSDCAEAIRDEGRLPALLQGVCIRWLERARRLHLIIARRKERQLEDASSPKQSRTRILLRFVVHQFIGTWGVVGTVAFLVFYTSAFFGLFGRAIPTRDIYWILNQTGYFPLQIGFALFLGWLLGRDLGRRLMLWVWVLPFLVLCYAVAAVPTFFPWGVPPSLQSGVGQSRLWHYFGPGCQSELRCGDQMMVTMHFYAAAAYSIGALLAPRVPEDYRLASAIRFCASLTVGLVLLVGTISMVIEIVQSHGQTMLRQMPEGLESWRWLLLPVGLFPAIVGACLIDFAFSIRGNQETHTRVEVP
jgi:hypothetical protein